MVIEYGISLSLSIDEIPYPLCAPDDLLIVDRPGEYGDGNPLIQLRGQVHRNFVNRGLEGDFIYIELRVQIVVPTHTCVKGESDHPFVESEIARIFGGSPRIGYGPEILAVARFQFARFDAPVGVYLFSEREAAVRHGRGVKRVDGFARVQDQEDRAVFQLVFTFVHVAIAKGKDVAFAQSLAACLDQNDIVFDLDIGVFHRHLKGVYDFACYGIFQGRGHLRQHDLPCAAVGIDIGPLVQGKPLVARWKFLQGLHPLIFGDGLAFFPVGCGCLGIVVHI